MTQQRHDILLLKDIDRRVFCLPGMSETHLQTEKYSVSEYAREQRKLHKQILREQQKAAGIANKRATRQVRARNMVGSHTMCHGLHSNPIQRGLRCC